MTRVPAILIATFADRDAAAHEAASRWSADAASIQHVSTGAAFTYRFTAGSRALYLRLMPPHWRSAAEVRGELAFIDHLDARGIQLARPVRSARGDRIERVDTSIGSCIALAFEEVRGGASDDVHWSPDQAHAAGALMARMHDAVANFTLPPGTERPSWRDEFRGLAGELPPEDALWRTINATRTLLESLPTEPDGYGVVHFDLSGDNLIWNGLSPTAVDFDDAMWHWFVADIARTTACFRADEGGKAGEREAAFLDGYLEVRPLSDYWRDLLPEFVRLSLVSELAWMSYARERGADIELLSANQEAAFRVAIERYREP